MRQRSAAGLLTRRDATVARLRDAFAAGRLSVPDLERRLERAEYAKNLAELRELTRDLDAPGDTWEQRITAVCSGTSRRGAWAVPRVLRVRAILGGATLDFRKAQLQPGVTEVECTSVLGGVRIVVPEGLRVEANGACIAGAFEHASEGEDDPLPEYRLRITGRAILGTVRVRVWRPRRKRSLPSSRS